MERRINMPDEAAKQIMVIVKKPDGTFVKVPLSELKKSSTPIAPSSVPPIVATPPKDVAPLIKKEEPKPVVKATPVKLSKGDFRSPLEEKASFTTGSGIAPSRLDQAEEVMKKLSFKVLPDFTNRLRSIIQLRLKDVRGTKETKEMVLHSIKDGGLGLTAPQAEELEKVCQEFLGKDLTKEVLVKNINQLKKEIPKSVTANLPMVELNEIPEPYIPPPVPTTAAPFNSFVQNDHLREKKPKFSKDSVLNKEPGVEKKPPVAPKIQSLQPSFTISRPTTPLAMQDIVGEGKTMGPLEELKYVTLTDFRRLSKNPAEAATRLGQKFKNLKEESYILFLQAWSAWRMSPLFQECLHSVLNSLQKGATLVTVVSSSKDSIQMPEVEALVQMEKELN